MQLRLLRMIGFFSLLLLCAAVLWSGRALAAQNPGGACAVFDINHRLPGSDIPVHLAGEGNTGSTSSGLVKLLPAGVASL